MRTALLPLLAVCALAVGLTACGAADDAQAPTPAADLDADIRRHALGEAS